MVCTVLTGVFLTWPSWINIVPDIVVQPLAKALLSGRLKLSRKIPGAAGVAAQAMFEWTEYPGGLLARTR